MTSPTIEDRADELLLKGARARPAGDVEGAAEWPEPLDLRELAARDPDPPPMVIDDWLPSGYATLLGGHGGAGKSSIALQLAICVALGAEWCGLPVQQRRVLYLSCEDRELVLHWRLRRACDHAGVDMASLADRLDVLDLVGHQTILYGRHPLRGLAPTMAYNHLASRIESTGAEVVIVDGVTDTFGGNENDRAEVKQYVNALVGLITEARGAVLLVAHVNKAAASSGSTSEGYSGSTGWHNAVRARWYLRPETAQGEDGAEPTGDLLLGLQKTNFGSDNQSIRYRWDPNAHVFAGEPVMGTSTFERREQEAAERNGVLAALRSVIDTGDYCPAATNGQRTAYHVLSAAPGFPASLRSGGGVRRRFWRQIEELRRNGEIVERSIRRANRHYTPTLALKDSNGAACADASNASEAPHFGSTQDATASMRRMTQGVIGGARARTHAGPPPCTAAEYAQASGEGDAAAPRQHRVSRAVGSSVECGPASWFAARPAPPPSRPCTPAEYAAAQGEL